MNFVWYIIIGALSGLIAGKIMRGQGFGLIVNLIIGIVGGVLGGLIFGLFGLSANNLIGSLITSVIGSIVLLWLLGIFARKYYSDN